MARLTKEQAKDKLIAPKNSALLVDARNHEQRLVMHTEPILNKNHIPHNALADFQLWVKSLLPQDKYDRFIQLLRVPFDTVESTKSIFDALSKVYDAQDGYKKYDFASSELAEDFLEYTQKIEDSTFWSTRGFQALKNQINSLVVVDMPEVQTTFRPEPYYFILKSTLIIDLEYNSRTGNVEYVAYSQPGEKYIVLCDEFYRVYIKDKGGDYKLEFENPHTTYNDLGQVIDGLGYCPAEPFYKIEIANSKGIQKRAPITDVLGKLDWLLLWAVSQRYYELYAAWPPFVAFETECAYRDEQGHECQSGKINGEYWDGETRRPRVYDCPACKKKELIGPGTFLTVPTPKTATQFNMMDGDGPIKIIAAPVDTLTYINDRRKEWEDDIYLAVVGYDGDAMTTEAINQPQVHANFESKEANLDIIKNEGQRVQKWALDTIARLRYGKYFVKSNIDWGNEYFLKTIKDLLDQLKQARDNGMPMFFISTLINRIIQTKSKNNPDEQKRNYILSQLEPYPELSVTQMQSMLLNLEDPINYTIKLNFTTFIQQFEREQMNIVEFGSLGNFDTKIKTIFQKLTEYATNKRKDAASARALSGGNDGTQGPTNAGQKGSDGNG